VVQFEPALKGHGFSHAISNVILPTIVIPNEVRDLQFRRALKNSGDAVFSDRWGAPSLRVLCARVGFHGGIDLGILHRLVILTGTRPRQ